MPARFPFPCPSPVGDGGRGGPRTFYCGAIGASQRQRHGPAMEEGAATPESSTKARKPRGPNKQLMKVVFYEDENLQRRITTTPTSSAAKQPKAKTTTGKARAPTGASGASDATAPMYDSAAGTLTRASSPLNTYVEGLLSARPGTLERYIAISKLPSDCKLTGAREFRLRLQRATGHCANQQGHVRYADLQRRRHAGGSSTGKTDAKVVLRPLLLAQAL